jgi:hypothetical protein
VAFPVLPLAWDGFSSWRARRKQAAKGGKAKRFLTFADRLVLRTMAVNVVFLGVLFVWFPASVFTALSTRGDWFLDRSHASWTDGARQRLFGIADHLEWLWKLTHDNPFDEDQPTPKPSPSPSGSSGHEPTPSPSPGPKPKPDGGAEPDDTPKPDVPSDERRWPFATELHPAVANMPESVETDVASVGRYIAEQESDPYQRVKALHDYAADRVAYDAPSLAAGRYPPQDANTVFNTKTGVCAGYAKLLVALGKAAGVEVVYVVGRSRDSGGNVDGQGHAWNAVQIDGRWYLIDATWDAGYVNGTVFTRQYTSDYLLTPPEVFGLNHFPDDPDWQLRSTPISRGEFMRQPNVRPMLFAKGFQLVSPDRSQVTVDGELFELALDNTNRKSLMVQWRDKAELDAPGQRCEVTPGARTKGACKLPAGGTYHVSLWVGEEQYGTHWYAGQFEVNRR